VPQPVRSVRRCEPAKKSPTENVAEHPRLVDPRRQRVGCRVQPSSSDHRQALVVSCFERALVGKPSPWLLASGWEVGHCCGDSQPRPHRRRRRWHSEPAGFHASDRRARPDRHRHPPHRPRLAGASRCRNGTCREQPTCAAHPRPSSAQGARAESSQFHSLPPAGGRSLPKAVLAPIRSRCAQQGGKLKRPAELTGSGLYLRFDWRRQKRAGDHAGAFSAVARYARFLASARCCAMMPGTSTLNGSIVTHCHRPRRTLLTHRAGA
jgi:hypothetical protein